MWEEPMKVGFDLVPPTSHISSPPTNRTVSPIHMRISKSLCLLSILALASGASAQAPNTLTADERAAGWKLLFDGKTTAGWRAYGADTMPSGWQVVDGVFTRVSRAADIITRDDRKSTRLNSSHGYISYAVFCLKK